MRELLERLRRIEAVIDPPDCALAEAVLELVQVVKTMAAAPPTKRDFRMSAALTLEEWRIAPGTYGCYEVSNLGRVRRKIDGLLLKISKPRNKREYPAVMMRYIGLRKRRSVHTLVALAFVGPPPFIGAEVRHLDGDHLNPRSDNLIWGSRKDNADDRERHGTTARGERHGMKGKGNYGPSNGNYRVTPEMKERACELVRKGYTQRMAAEAIGISQKAVWSALRARANA